MEDSCPVPTPLVSGGRDSKSPFEVPSTPESGCEKSDTPSDRGSPDSRCVICLGRLQNKSFTDSCLHEFCFKCLLQWSKVKAECPLCKQPFKSIIHNVRSIVDYDQYEVPHHTETEPLENLLSVRNVASINASINASNILAYNFSLLPHERRFRYRSTMTTEYFRGIAQTFLVTARLQDEGQIPSAGPEQYTLRYQRRPRSRSHHTNRRREYEFRRTVYSHGLWVQPAPDVLGRFRECSPSFFRDNPGSTHRLLPWLNRELRVLLSNTSISVNCVLTVIIEALPQHSIRSREFRNKLRPFLGERTEHFIHEFYHFARSTFDIVGFYDNAVYGPRASANVQEVLSSSSSSSDDSDIEILNAIVREPVIAYDDEPVAGPSGLGQTNEQESIQVLDSDSTDDIQLIDYVKPTPEVVVLSSEDENENVNQNEDDDEGFVAVLHEVKSDESDVKQKSSGEQYHPSKVSRRKKTKTKRKAKSKRRNVSSSSESESDYKPLSYHVKKSKRKTDKKRKRIIISENSSSEEAEQKKRLRSCVVVPQHSNYFDYPSTSRASFSSEHTSRNSSSSIKLNNSSVHERAATSDTESDSHGSALSNSVSRDTFNYSNNSTQSKYSGTTSYSFTTSSSRSSISRNSSVSSSSTSD